VPVEVIFGRGDRICIRAGSTARHCALGQSMETVTVAVETATVASPTPLMFHCHILEHEDAGMMGQFITV
jgi:FtsP/CotA-like multicopper oxidase with cupredoxin domain